MEVTAGEVKKLREKTGAGVLDCKKALVQVGGDSAKAEKILKELGLAAAAKRSGKATNEGRVFSRVTEKAAGMLELSCETDFVARNEDFIRFGNELLETVIAKNLVELNDELSAKVADVVGRIKENITIRRFKVIPVGPGELAVDYIHGEGGIGVVVKLESDNPAVLKDERVRTFAFDVALHVAAYNPVYLSKDKVDASYLKEQEEIFTKQAEALGKPENVLASIVNGKVKKHLSEICLLQQAFVKDDKQSVQEMQEKISREVRATLRIMDYLYFRVGEEIE